MKKKTYRTPGIRFRASTVRSGMEPAALSWIILEVWGMRYEYSQWAVNEYSQPVQSMSTVNEYRQWVQARSTVNEYSKWVQAMGTVNQYSHWVQFALSEITSRGFGSFRFLHKSSSSHRESNVSNNSRENKSGLICMCLYVHCF